jgi:hypothetical protein
MTIPVTSAAVTPADASAFGNFHLTSSLLKSYEGYALETAKDPCRYGILMALSGLDKHASLDQAAAHYDARPGVHAMLKKHGLTARKALLTATALMAASFEVLSESPKGKKLGMTSSGTRTPAMKDNVAFYKAHQAKIKRFGAKMHAAAKQNLRDNGGKLPECLTHPKQR